MVDYYNEEKFKKDESFQRFFLIAIVFHIVVFFLLNLQKAGKLDLSKESIIPFGMVKLPPSPEAAAAPKEAIPPPKTDIQTKAEQIQDNTPKAFKEDLEIKPMDVVQPDERDLLRERLGDVPPPALRQIDIGKLDEGGGSRVALPAAFGHTEATNEGGSGRASDWGIYAEDGSGSGTGGGDGTGGYGKKKAIERYSYGQLALKGLVSRVPDWVEKSNKIIITSVRIWISPEGKVIKAEVAKSSGYLELDQLALDYVYKKEDYAPSKEGNVRVAIIDIDFAHIR